MTGRPYAMLVTAALAASAFPAFAADGPELYISPKGEIRITNAPISNRHSLNLFSTIVWGVTWTVPIDQFTSVETADGKKIEFSEIADDHRLEIKGSISINSDPRRRGWLDTKLIRDLSLGSPPPATPPAPLPTPPPQTAAIATALTPPPPPPAAAAPSPSGKPKLTRQLSIGMRGGEVFILQEFLQKHGWGIPNDGPVTGYYGKVTANAVKKFQNAKGLPPEGEVGPKTRALINELLP